MSSRGSAPLDASKPTSVGNTLPLAHLLICIATLSIVLVSQYNVLYIHPHSIAHLDHSVEVLELPVSGSSLMPYCHFELDPSDYLSRRASAGDVASGFTAASPSSIDVGSTRVIEFSSCGVGVKNVKYVL